MTTPRGRSHALWCPEPSTALGLETLAPGAAAEPRPGAARRAAGRSPPPARVRSYRARSWERGVVTQLVRPSGGARGAWGA